MLNFYVAKMNKNEGRIEGGFRDQNRGAKWTKMKSEIESNLEINLGAN